MDDDPIYALPQAMSAGNLAVSQGGMTLRDWFAGQALAGLLASPHTKVKASNEDCAKVSYGIADAMMAARLTGMPRDCDGEKG